MGKTALAFFMACKVGGTHLYVGFNGDNVRHFQCLSKRYATLLASHGISASGDVTHGLEKPGKIHAVSRSQLHKFCELHRQSKFDVLYIDESDLQSTDDNRWSKLDPDNPPTGMTAEDVTAHNERAAAQEAATKPQHKTRRILTEMCHSHARRVCLLTATPNWDESVVPDVVYGRVKARQDGHNIPELMVRIIEVDAGETSKDTRANMVHALVTCALKDYPANRAGDGIAMIKCHDVAECNLVAAELNKVRENSARVFVSAGATPGLEWDHTQGATTGLTTDGVQFVTTVYRGSRGLDHAAISSTYLLGDSDEPRFLYQLSGRADRWQGDRTRFTHVTCDVGRSGRVLAKLFDIAYSGCINDLAELPEGTIETDTVSTRGEVTHRRRAATKGTTKTTAGGARVRAGGARVRASALVDETFSLAFDRKLGAMKRQLTKALKIKYKRTRSGADDTKDDAKDDAKDDEKKGVDDETKKEDEAAPWWSKLNSRSPQDALKALEFDKTISFKRIKTAKKHSLAGFCSRVGINLAKNVPGTVTKWNGVREVNTKRLQDLYLARMAPVIVAAKAVGFYPHSANHIDIHRAAKAAFGDVKLRKPTTDPDNATTGGLRDPYELVLCSSRAHKCARTGDGFDPLYRALWFPNEEVDAATKSSPVERCMAFVFEHGVLPRSSGGTRAEGLLYKVQQRASRRTDRDSNFADRVDFLASPAYMRFHVNGCSCGTSCLVCAGKGRLATPADAANEPFDRSTTPKASKKWAEHKYRLDESDRLALLAAQKQARIEWNKANEAKKATGAKARAKSKTTKKKSTKKENTKKKKKNSNKKKRASIKEGNKKAKRKKKTKKEQAPVKEAKKETAFKEDEKKEE